jgi:hypothetical protein
MTLREQRCLFTLLTARLIFWAFEQGYQIAYGEVKRSAEQAKANAADGVGISNSLHLLGLAVDFDLYVDGVYQTRSEAHAAIGAHWKCLHPLARWGGDFKDAKGRPRPDGNHYSLEWQGVK